MLKYFLFCVIVILLIVFVYSLWVYSRIKRIYEDENYPNSEFLYVDRLKDYYENN